MLAGKKGKQEIGSRGTAGEPLGPPELSAEAGHRGGVSMKAVPEAALSLQPEQAVDGREAVGTESLFLACQV